MDLVVSTPRFPVGGETVLGHSLREVPGGKGANQAVAAARLAAEVTMIGRVGSDRFGALLREQLSEQKVDVTDVRKTDGSSGVAIVCVDDRGENSIVVVPGANGYVSTIDINESELLIRNADCLILQLELPVETVVHAVRVARKQGKLVLLNPAPMPPVLDQRLLDVDVFCVNKSEAEMHLGISITTIDDAKSAAVRLQSQGPRAVIVTLGGDGAVICEGSSPEWIAPLAVHVVDTTAAGDAFIGALAFQLCQFATLKEAATFASAAGAFAATLSGAQPSLPRMEDIESILEQNNLAGI